MRRPRRLAAALTAAARLSRWLGPAPTGPERRIGERIGPTPSANSPHRSLALLERRKGTVFVFRLGIDRAPVIVGAADVGRPYKLVPSRERQPGLSMLRQCRRGTDQRGGECGGERNFGYMTSHLISPCPSPHELGRGAISVWVILSVASRQFDVKFTRNRPLPTCASVSFVYGQHWTKR